MKAVVKAHPGPGVELRDVNVPRPGPGETLVRVAATSVCGTDLHIYEWDAWAQSRIRPPLIVGHELAGHVEEVGPEVTLVKPGDYVSAETHVYCGRCRLCQSGHAHICQNLQILGVDRDGSFAEYIVVPENVLWKNDPALPFRVASVQEPFGNAVHVAMRADVLTKTVVVIGDGPTGLFAVAVAKTMGAATVWAVGLLDRRLDLAKTLGADAVINATRDDPVAQVQGWTDALGADVVFEMSGSEIAFSQGIEMLRPGGRLIAFGIPQGRVPLDVATMVFKEIEVIGVVGRLIFTTWHQMAKILHQVDITPVISHELPLTEYERGFALARTREATKVVFYPG